MSSELFLGNPDKLKKLFISKENTSYTLYNQTGHDLTITVDGETKMVEPYNALYSPNNFIECKRLDSICQNLYDYDCVIEVLDKETRAVLFRHEGAEKDDTIQVNLTLTADVEIYMSGDNWCLVAGTKILMADGTEKNIEDIAVGDLVMGFDPAAKAPAAQTVTKVGNGPERVASSHTLYTLEGGTALDVANRHEFYCVEDGRVKYADEFKAG